MSFDAVGLLTDGHASGFNTSFLAYCPVMVRVIDEAGAAVSGATVTIGSTVLTTDGSGLIDETEFAAGTYSFLVSKPGYRSVLSEVTLDGRRDWTIPLKPTSYPGTFPEIMDVIDALKVDIDADPTISGMHGWNPCVRCYDTTMPDLAGSGKRTIYICPLPDEHRGGTNQGTGRRADGQETHTFGVYYNIALYPCVTIEGKGAEGLLTDDEGLEALSVALKNLLRYNDLNGLIPWMDRPIGIQRDVGSAEHGGSFYHKLHRVMIRVFAGQDDT
jgi:hypothetical protein